MKLVKKNGNFYLSDGTFSCRLPANSSQTARKMYLHLVKHAVIARSEMQIENVCDIAGTGKAAMETKTKVKNAQKTAVHSVDDVHKMWLECSKLKKESSNTIRDKMSLKKNLTDSAFLVCGR